MIVLPTRFQSIDRPINPGRFVLGMAFVFVLAIGNATQAQSFDPSMATGVTTKSHRHAAAHRIPYDEMAPEAARKVAEVVRSASIYRQLPVTSINSDPDMYLYLIRYPEVIISTWRLMNVSEMTAQRVAPFQLRSTDGAGTTTNVELVYGKPNLNIYYAEGVYDGPMLFRKVTGKCVIILESDYRRDARGDVQVVSRLNVFLKIDNLAASIIAKTVHPLIGTTADHNFVESLKFIEKLSDTTERNGPGVQRMATRLQGLSRDVRSRFMEVAGIVHHRNLQRNGASNEFTGSVQNPESAHSYQGQVNRASYRGR